MLRVCVLDGDQLKTGGAELLAVAGPMWVDLEPPSAETLAGLKTRFGLHSLEIEDCLHLDQRPKIEEYPGHQFIVLQGFTAKGNDLREVIMHELHLFVGQGWVLSVHDQPHQDLEALIARIQADPKGTLGKGSDFVAYLLTDALVDRNFPLLDAFNDALEDIEERVFNNPSPDLMQEVFGLKRTLAHVRRVLSPQRDVVGLLARRGMAYVNESTSLYFRDVYDHLVRIYEQIDAARDLLGNAMEAHLSVIANRTNEVTKQLTIFASIFMPLSFVVGFFGQNFAQVQTPLMLGVMTVLVPLIPVAMIIWFRVRKWF